MSSSYLEVKEAAQRQADAHRLYFRVRRDIFGNWRAHGVPKPKNQYGADRDGELIQPSTYREEDWT